MDTKILPASITPFNPLLNKVDDWQQNDVGFAKKHALSRLIVVVAGAPFAAISALYNAFAFTLKAPITLLKYTILFIPVKSDWTTLGSVILPKGFELTEMGKHIYKIVMFTIDIGFCPVMGFISPNANIVVHEFFGLIELNRSSAGSKSGTKQPISTGSSEVLPPKLPVTAPIAPPPPSGKLPPPAPKGKLPPPSPKGKLPPKPIPKGPVTTPHTALVDAINAFQKNKLKHVVLGVPPHKSTPKVAPMPKGAPIPKGTLLPKGTPVPKGRPLPSVPKTPLDPKIPDPKIPDVKIDPPPKPKWRRPPGTANLPNLLDQIKRPDVDLKPVELDDKVKPTKELSDLEKAMLERRRAMATRKSEGNFRDSEWKP